ncbi:TetR/AcrR family transcriptional regulator [Paludisphaera rhizosphaerae]|uniref:TetR/AcrR family transcriptional regulator n=1 Tax=Paludisphaera rhizosphaerae TaxID=2711216 RepID=UPI00197D1F56|nr:TetR/AcrR family transcriptional regulator [Paludisphaera rhizosphaerae]
MNPSKTARERVLETAEDLFYREGVRAVGIDTIIARSGVAKMSLYRNFPSKDDLVVAYLEARNRRFFANWDRAVGSEDAAPRARLRGLIEATLKRVSQAGYRGCPFLNSAAEFPAPDHPARAVISEHKREVRARLLGLCRDLKARNPETLTAQLIVLLDGVYASAGSLTASERAAVLKGAEAMIDASVNCP